MELFKKNYDESILKECFQRNQKKFEDLEKHLKLTATFTKILNY
jgi:hypothetical protein